MKDGTTATAQQLVWNSPGGSTKWELYLGTRASNSVSPRWRVKTELSTTDSGAKYISGSDSKYYYNINTSALHRHWDAYGVDKSIKTPRLQGGTRYCYQIKCIMPDGSHKWSNVASLTFLPSVRITAVDNEKIFTATDRGGTGIEFAYKAGTDKQYTYKQFTFTNNDNLSDFWGLISSLNEDTNFLVLVEGNKCGKDIKQALIDNETYYCNLDNFGTAAVADLKFNIIENSLRQVLDSLPLYNLKDLLEGCYTDLKVNVSPEEKTNHFKKFSSRISFKLTESGDYVFNLKVYD